jgi:hypothetical protein
MIGAGNRVRFLVAGVQKAGTSALFDYLREVPALQLPELKEAHHFDDESIDWARPDHRAYDGLFAADGRLWGEATPIYLYWPNSLERIRTYDPAMRIILLFRDPIERAFSHWRMEYARRKETEPFAWCIRDGRARVAAGDPAAPGHHRIFSYVERGFYGRQVERLWEIFPPAQTLLLRQDELDRDPDAVVARVCDFLGVEAPSWTLVPRRILEAERIAYPSILTDEDRAFLATLYQEDMRHFVRLTGMELSAD